MSNVHPVVNPGKDTTKSPNNTPMAKDDTLPNKKKPSSNINKTNLKRKPSVVDKLRRSASGTIEQVANNIGEADIGVDGVVGLGIKGVIDVHKDLVDAIGDRTEFKLTGWILRFADMKEEYKFQEHWRRKSTPSAVCVISFFFYLYKGFSRNPMYLTPEQNIATTSFACISALLLFLIIQCTYTCFHRFYDWINGCVILHVVLTVIIQNYLGSISTNAYEFKDSCYGPSCDYLYPSTLVMLCMYGASTVLRMRFVPVAILILIIVIVEETLLNYGDIAVEPWDIVAQLYCLALVIWGCLVEAHAAEISHRKTYVLAAIFTDSPEQLAEIIKKERYSCCYDKMDKKHCGCLKFRDKFEQKAFEGYDRHERLTGGVGLGSTVFATLMAAILFLFATLPEGSNLDDYWTLVYLPNFIPLFICIAILFVAWIYWTYMQKSGKNGFASLDLKSNNVRNQRLGTCFTMILPGIFLFSWLLTLSLTKTKAMLTYYDASPLEQVPCLSQSEWMEIVSEGSIDVAPLNSTICAMTKGYNITNNQTVCNPEHFEAITHHCKPFSLLSYFLFILQTTQLWIQRDMAKASTMFVVSMFFYLLAVAIILDDFAYAFLSLTIQAGAYYFGIIVILYEHIIVTQEAFILERFMKKSKAVKSFRDSVVNKALGITGGTGIKGTSRWALAAKAALGQK